LSKPSKSKGLIIARGHFSTSLYASLSRSQIDFGSPSTFGLEVTRCPFAYDPKGEYLTQDEIVADSEAAKKKAASNGSSFRLGRMIDRGCFNYRWPVTEYYLDLHENHEAIETAKIVKFDAEWAAKAITSDLGGIIEVLESSEEDDNEEGETSTDENEGVAMRQQEQSIPPGQIRTRTNVALSTQRQVQSTPPLGGKSTEEKDKPKLDEEPPRKHVGTCQMFSCVKDEMFYQVLRIEELRDDGAFNMCFPADSQIVLTIGGPVCKEYPRLF
jgi:hypothetical protein